MRSATILAVLIGAALALPAAAPAAKDDPKPRTCADVKYETGSGYYIYRSSRITALGARCPAAKRLARVNPGQVTGTDERPRYRAYAFACKGTRKSTRTVAFRCVRAKDKAVVTFSWTTK